MTVFDRLMGSVRQHIGRAAEVRRSDGNCLQKIFVKHPLAKAEQLLSAHARKIRRQTVDALCASVEINGNGQRQAVITHKLLNFLGFEVALHPRLCRKNNRRSNGAILQRLQGISAVRMARPNMCRAALCRACMHHNGIGNHETR